MQAIGLAARAAASVLARADAAVKTAALQHAAAAVRAARDCDPRGQCRGYGGRAEDGSVGRHARPAAARRASRRRHGRRSRCDGRAARSDRHRTRALDAPQRSRHRARAHSDRRHRHHLRIASQRDGRCRRPVPARRQCGDLARRLRELRVVGVRSRPVCGAASPPPGCPKTPCSSSRRAIAQRSA